MQSKHPSAWLQILGRIFILVAILLPNLGAPLPAAQAAGSNPGNTLFLPVVNNGLPKDGGSPPTAQQLIQEDLDAGRIDAHTALLYRAYAEYGDPRLPDKYGYGFMVEDPAFFRLAQDPDLPAEMKAKLEPFLVRPDDPKSIYNTTSSGNAPITAEQGEGGTGLICDENNLTSKDSAQADVKIRVHSKCTGTSEATIVANIDVTLQYMEELWKPMTDLMGLPIRDLEGGSGAIDIYLVTPVDELERHDNVPIGSALGVTPPSSLTDGDRSSGYIMVNRYMLQRGAFFQQLLAHEFFHVLQNAHNASVSFNDNLEEWWFVEASATWAEAHFVPSNSGETHRTLFPIFQKSSKSLHAPGKPGDSEHIYAAYIWPFFLEQEKGAESIANIWRGLRTVGANWEAANQKVDQELPFSQNFRRFALRNLNISLEPGDPIWPRYIDFDPQFPDQKLPAKLEGTTFDMQEVPPLPDPMNLGVQIPALDAEYYHFTFKPEVLSIELDLGKVSQLSGVAVEAVVKWRGKPWEHRPLTSQPTVKLCDVEELYLIFSNESLVMNDPAAVSFTLASLAEGCNCQQVANVASWDANITVSYSIAANNSRKQITEDVSTSVNTHLEESYRNPSAIGFWSSQLGGNGNFHYRNIWLYPTGNYLWSELVGNGPPTPYDPNTSSGSRMALTFDMETCTYSFYVSVWIMGTSADEEHPPSPVNMGIATAGSAEYAIPFSHQATTLTGSGTWQAHGSDYIISLPTKIDYFVQDDYDIYSILGEDNMGVAQVSWSFTPVEGP